MTIHFVCRGNVLRSLIAETYLKSLNLPDVVVTSSGTIVDLLSPTEVGYFANTLAVLKRHGLGAYAKAESDQLTQERASGQDITVCMNHRVVEEAEGIATLPGNTVVWEITDIGEGQRIDEKPGDRERYEEVVFAEIIAKVDELVQTL